MAHIPDGVLSLPVLAFGAAVTVAGCALGLRRLTAERIPQAALLSAAFFIAALVRFPVGPSSVHLILNGIVGITLGWAAFPTILVAALLQMVMFGFGGVAVLGANVMNMAVPAVIAGAVFHAVSARWMGDEPVKTRRVAVAAGFAGALGVALTALGVAGSLRLSGREFLPAAELVLMAHVPVMLIEGFFTAAAIGLIARVKPEMLEAPFRSVGEAAA